LAGVTVEALGEAADERKVDCSFDFSEQVIVTDPSFEAETIEQFTGDRLLVHHETVLFY
jgi:hypothetical protein